MNDLAIRINNVSKCYQISTGKRRVTHFSEAIASGFTNCAKFLMGQKKESYQETIWALKDISFDVLKGDVVGVLGLNGAGKSTLLKLISRITEPTSGEIELYGRVGSLLEVGVGFHAELTGRDNIQLSGAVLGMKRSEIARKFDEIVGFAEIGKFLDTPVKWYSSGMYVRLAFAVAAHLEQEILIVDEVLAVGDAAFQQKCLQKMDDIAQQGRTVIYVSHNLNSISSLCNKVVYIKDGQLQQAGPLENILPTYLSDIFHEQHGELTRFRRHGMGHEIKFTNLRIVSESGPSVIFGQHLSFELKIFSEAEFKNLSIRLGIYDTAGYRIGSACSRESFAIGANQEIKLQVTIQDLNIAPGQYYAGFAIEYGEVPGTAHELDEVIGTPVFQILAGTQKKQILSNWSSKYGHVVFEDLEMHLLQ